MKLSFGRNRNIINIMRKSDRKIFFAGLRVYMKDQHITQTMMAEVCKVDQTTISNWMNLKTNPEDEAYDVLMGTVGKTKAEIMTAGHNFLLYNSIGVDTDMTTSKSFRMNKIFQMLSEIENDNPEDMETIDRIVGTFHDKLKKRGAGTKTA